MSGAKKFHVTTFGCQMNVHDSERMRGMLASLGYEEAGERGEADLILFNTCSIRESADSRFIAHLGEAKRLKSEDPERVVGVGGCWAQSVKDHVFRQFPFVDVAFGPGQVHKLAEFLTSDSITAQGFFEFEGFIETARQASNDLSRFNSRIGRAVDHILSTNRWTLRVIDGVASQDANRGTLNKWISKNLNVFAPFQPVALTRNTLLDQYLRHTGAVEEQILHLITEAQALLAILDNLDGRLDVIASIATRDGINVENGKDELLSLLWTKLGGHRSSVAKLDKQLSLLSDVGQYRRMAWAHVNSAVIKLMAIRDNLEDLRERVAMPETLGDIVPLEVHINNINLGIARLEEQREAGRKVMQERIAQLSSRAAAEAKTMRIGEKDL